MAERCGEMDFSLYGGEGYKMVEGVATFKYLGRPIDQRYDDWPEIRQNIIILRTVWGRLGNLLQREGADPRVPEIFYRAVTQAVLLFGS